MAVRKMSVQGIEQAVLPAMEKLHPTPHAASATEAPSRAAVHSAGKAAEDEVGVDAPGASRPDVGLQLPCWLSLRLHCRHRTGLAQCI